MDAARPPALVVVGCSWGGLDAMSALLDALPGHFALSTEDRVRSARPSADLLFETAADTYGARTAGVVLTGSGSDGARGLAQIKRRGGHTLVQDPGSAARPEMPTAALAACEPDVVGNLGHLAVALGRLGCGKSPAVAAGNGSAR